MNYKDFNKTIIEQYANVLRGITLEEPFPMSLTNETHRTRNIVGFNSDGVIIEEFDEKDNYKIVNNVIVYDRLSVEELDYLIWKVLPYESND